MRIAHPDKKLEMANAKNVIQGHSDRQERNQLTASLAQLAITSQDLAHLVVEGTEY